MIFNSYIFGKSRFLLLTTAIFMLINSFFVNETATELYKTGSKAEISARETLNTLPVESSSYKPDRHQTISVERIDKAEQIHYLFIKNKFKEALSKEDRFDGLTRLRFFLLTQFSTST